jgi:hypothetical protein
LKYKVFLDTSTLVAGSVFLTSKIIGVDIKDIFYDEATRLISLIRKHINKRLGITTYAVEDEAYQVLSSAIERKLNQKIADREKVFALLSVAINACESRLRDILSFVVRDPIDPKESAKWHIQVAIMYDDLHKIALTLPKPASLQAAAVPKFLNKAEMFEIYRNQDECLNAQLTNLIYNPVEDSDKILLAQAIYLCRLYKETETEAKITMYLSSTDHHFVPVKRMAYTSRQVTDEIEERFDIFADKPHEIFLVFKKEYGE